MSKKMRKLKTLIILVICVILTLNQHKTSVHETNQDESKFKYDLCEYVSNSRKGVNIHKGSKHKASKTAASISSIVSSSQSPISCILQEEGCPNLVSSYYTKYTAICMPCSIMMKEKLESSPYLHTLCPCCHLPSTGAPFSLCRVCLDDIQVDGYTESDWGSWHLDRNNGKIICIDLNFD